MPETTNDLSANIQSLSTFRLPARAAEVIRIDHPDQLPKLPSSDRPELILGGGSNTVFLSDYPGRILLDRLQGLRFEALPGDKVRVVAAAGESWHGLVRRCLDEGLHGIENLALIPGTVGAAPIQNIGAYGVELDQVFESLEAWDREARRWVTLDHDACAFAYRDSRFKSHEPDRYFITEVRLRLSRQFSPCLDYASLAEALEQAETPEPTARQLVAAILRLRRHRLPDPNRLANAGSFFKNPIVNESKLQQALACMPDLAHWQLPDGRIKLAAGAMIEKLGFKGCHLSDTEDGIGIYKNHALVLVNHGRGDANALKALIEQVQRAFVANFGIKLDAEPKLVG